MVKLILVGCRNFNFKGELFTRGEGKNINTYLVSEDKADVLLGRRNEAGRPYFRRVSDTDTIKVQDGDKKVDAVVVEQQGGDTGGIDDDKAPTMPVTTDEDAFGDDGVDTHGEGGQEITV